MKKSAETGLIEDDVALTDTFDCKYLIVNIWTWKQIRLA